MNIRALAAASAAAAITITGLVGPGTTAGAATSRPAAVKDLAPFQKSGPVTLSWTNPRDIDRDVVRLARGDIAPPTTHSGRPIALSRPRAARAVLAGLVAGRQYSVSVWTKRGGVLSQPTTTSFTTKSASSTPNDRLGTLAGHVVDTSGDPLRNAEVVAFDYNTGEHGYLSRTDSQGAFRMAVPVGPYFIVAIGNHAKGGTSDGTGYQFDAKQSPVQTGHTGLRFVLAGAGAITGVVTDSAGSPLRGVEVDAYDAPAYLASDASTGLVVLGGGADEIAHTNANGRYRINGVAPGAVVPCFATGHASGGRSDAAGYVSRCDDRSAVSQVGHPTTVETVALDSAPRVAREPLGSMAGTVSGPTGKRLAGARVETENATGDSYAETRTNSRGHFVFRRLTPGRWEVCGGHASAYGCAVVKVVAHHTVTATLRVKPAGTLSGVVRDEHGARLGNAHVEVERVANNMGEGYDATADSHGNWSIAGLTPGLWKVCFSGGGSARDPFGGLTSCLSKKVRVVPGRDRIGLDSALPPGGAVAGTVTDSNGKPAAGVAVLVVHPSRYGGYGTVAMSGAHGNFLAGGLKPGRYRVCAELDYDTGGALTGCAGSVIVTAKHITQGADVSLPADAPLTATVTDDSGNSLSGVDVAVLSACQPGEFCTSQPVFSSGAGVDVAASAVTGPDGSVTFHGLRPGHYTACALAYYAASTAPVPATGFADKCASSKFTLHVTRGGTPTTTIALDPGAAVTGQVVDAAGNPLSNVAVHVPMSAARDYVSDSGGFDGLYPSPSNDLVTDADGRYTVRSILPGSRKLCGVPPGGSGVHRGCLASPVALTAGDTTEAPTLTLASSSDAMRAQRTAPLVASTGLSFVHPRARFLPAARRIPVVSSSGWPEFRLLPHH